MVNRKHIIIAFCLCLLATASAAESDLPLEQIELPDGFSIQVYNADVPNARAMTMAPDGTIFVGTRRAGNLYAIRDADQDQVAEQTFTIDTDLNMPTGLVFHQGSLYVAVVNRLLRYDNLLDNLDNPPEPTVLVDDLPDRRHHGWRFLEVGPDNRLYMPIGAPCNICDEPGFAVIVRMNLDGSDRTVVAEGVRNSVGLAFHPENGDLWFTDNGRDMMGDNLPPCELNHLSQQGQHFGYPFCHGEDVLDPVYGDGKSCADYRPPAQELGPHVAPLGLTFYTGKQFPDAYHHQVLIAEHGSWNRSEKIGYRVMLVRLEGKKAVSYEPFASGWLQGQENWGRPVDVLNMPDGAILVSDDQAGVVYRISYDGA